MEKMESKTKTNPIGCTWGKRGFNSYSAKLDTYLFYLFGIFDLPIKWLNANMSSSIKVKSEALKGPKSFLSFLSPTQNLKLIF